MDQTIWFREGLARDILVKIKEDYVPVDFIILDMGADEEVPLILGRSFHNTTNVVIYVGLGQIHFHFQFSGWKVKCFFNNYKTNKQENHPKRRPHATSRQRNQPTKVKEDKQAKSDEQIKKDEPAEPKSNPKPKRVWRKKVVPPSWSPSPRPTEAPAQWTLMEKSSSRDLKYEALAEK